MFSENRWEDGQIDQKLKFIKNSRLKKTISKIKKCIDRLNRRQEFQNGKLGQLKAPRLKNRRGK